jgi:hypothetical protein
LHKGIDVIKRTIPYIQYSSIGDGRLFGTSKLFQNAIKDIHLDNEACIQLYHEEAASVLLYVVKDMIHGDSYSLKHTAGGGQGRQNDHVDMAGKDGLLVHDREKRVLGYDGFSSFIALTENCDMWITDKYVSKLSDTGEDTAEGDLIGKQLVKIPKGSCLILPNGTFHAGSSNMKGTETVKIFTAVGNITRTSTDQIWFDYGLASDLTDGRKRKKGLWVRA